MRKMSSITLPSGINLHLKVVNNRMLSVTPGHRQYEILDENDKLVGLDYSGEYLISKGSVLQVGNQKYKISEIQRSTTTQGYELYTFRKITTTGTFIVPFLGEDRTYFRWALEFVNAFIGTIDSPDTDHVSILYRFDGSVEFANFEEKLKSREDFVSAKDTDKYHILYTFKLPSKFKVDIDTIIQGKYSEVSEEAKQTILDFHYSDKKKPIGQILFKCPLRRKEMEKELGHEIPSDNELFEMFHTPNEQFHKHFIIQEKDGGSTIQASDFI
jgi:hypothetical protein